jgi:hypothetical protein
VPEGGVCEDLGVPLLVIGLILALLRRVRPITLALAVFEVWRRLPPRYRRSLLLAAQRNTPRVASSLARRARPPA